MMPSNNPSRRLVPADPLKLDAEARARVSTRYLGVEKTDNAAALPRTGPFDRVLPFVVEFRVVGTASLLQAEVEDAMLIGRGDDNSPDCPQINLTNHEGFEQGVSRKHAVIVIRDKRLWLKDLNSTNGTRLNGQVCQPGEEQRLHHGDEITLGRLRLQVSFSVVPANDTQRVDKALKSVLRDGAGRHVLVIEDDEHIAHAYRMALEYAGYRVTCAPDITRAMAYCFQKMPDAIVIDMLLPAMNALDMVRYVRKQPQAHPTPLVLIGTPNGYQMSQALSAGADAFLNTPVSVEDLIKSVRAAITR